MCRFAESVGMSRETRQPSGELVIQRIRVWLKLPEWLEGCSSKPTCPERYS